MSVERENIEHILDVREEKDGHHLQVEPVALGKLGMQIEKILNDPDNPTPSIHFKYDTAEPFRRFAIMENSEKEQQIVLQIRGKYEPNLEATPNSLSIRLLDRRQQTVTRAIFTLGHMGIVTTDFDVTWVSTEQLQDFDTERTLEMNADTPQWFDYNFLAEVSASLEGSSRNLALEEQSLTYYTHDGRYETV